MSEPGSPDELRARVDALERELPRLSPEHERALRDELALGAAPLHPLGRLEDRLAILMAERENLLRDRRTSLRARTWPARVRLRWWMSPRTGVLWQHPPAAVRVPRRYARTRPPSPAPAISIVTPSFGQAEFIERTIRSVVGQGYPALEYAIQDGGSTDGTVDVLRRWEHALRWESRRDDGQANAVNLGFAGTSGELMAYLNSDDVLLPGALAYVARYFDEHPEVDVVYGHRVLIDEHDRQVGIWALPPHDAEMLEWIDPVPQETLFWRQAVWERAGGAMDESFRYALDWDLLLRFRDAGAKMVRLNRYLGAFRVHEAQKTTSLRSVGDEETARLRAARHGREVHWRESMRRMRPYLRRQVVHHTAHRLVARLPGRRMTPDWLSGR